MSNLISNVIVCKVIDGNSVVSKFSFPTCILLEYDPEGINVRIRKEILGHNEDVSEFAIFEKTECSRLGPQMYVITVESESILLKFSSDLDAANFHKAVMKVKAGREKSAFTERTDESSALQYFQFYGYLSQQQNMMQDYIRTSTYQRAILANLADFKDKVVLDVGAGSGILSFFAVQAGAMRVYAVEASTMAQHAETLVSSNNLEGKIVVIAGKIEEIELPENVDVIVSEPMGYMLYNERMLETYLHAKKWLKPNGRMFPSRGDLHIAPFTDDSLYMEQFNKANFWFQQSFHGVDLRSLRQAAMKEYFRQPIVDTFDVRVCMSKSVRHTVDFMDVNEKDLHKIDIPLEFHLLESGTVHGLAFWFDVAFIGSVQTIWLSTAPTEPLTHWYQVRCLLETPIFVKAGQLLTGRVLLVANQRQSYDVTIELNVEGTGTRSSNTLDLKNPYFRYTGQAAAAPPGVNHTSPSESYWSQLDAQGARQAVNMVNGISVNGLGEVAMDVTQSASSLVGLGNQPSIHPGSITSTGRQRVGAGAGTATSTQGAQLIGGGISPTLFTAPTHQLVLGNTSHYPVNNSLMIGDYVTPGSSVLTVPSYRQ
ncbi:histone-arginine methyltransferase CARMER isoform X4 [Bacillus rossius redtenbacheri]|uniref:histone-arginine methyltransferase CARMER isoform X4 n=1 Tax=Bacillus rossius redtenbacheri TaxID=93214 RepID=UPI002FDEDAEC